MSFLLRDRIHTTLVDSVYNEVLSKRSNYYYYIGRVLKWPDELVPPIPFDLDSYEYETRNKIIAVKKLQPTDVSYVIKRVNWIAGTVYDQYDGEYSESNPAYSGATKIKDANFYVLNSSFNVYKCLFNFNNSQSIVEPTGFETLPVTTSDGYVWKYMYTIPVSLRNRFLTENFMPVTRANLNKFFSRGQINNVSVLERGSGYTGNSDVKLIVSGTFDETLSNITVNFQGSGYQANVQANTVVVIETFGNVQPTSNATANLLYFTDIDLGNIVSGVVITNRGDGYSQAVQANTFANIITTGSIQPTSNANLVINFKTNSTANLEPVFNLSGSIVDVKIRNPGENYKTADIFVQDSLFSGTSLFKNLRSVNITNEGVSYLQDVVSNTTVTVKTDGILQPTTNVLLDLAFVNNVLNNVAIINSGNGYTPDVISNTSATITTLGNAQPSVNATISLNFSNSSILVPVLTDGKISHIVIEDPGLGYSSNIQTKLVLTGDGANAELVPYVNELGEVEDVIIENTGDGYTYVDIEVVGSGSGANVIAFFDSGDLDTAQGLVETSAISGGLHSFRVINAGNNYTHANIIVSGDGSGFVGSVKLTNVNTISHIEVIIPGSGYTYANVDIIGNGGNAIVTPIFAPQGGHGKNAVDELYSDTLGFYSTINNEKIHGVDVNNDYRQFGLIKDVNQFDSEKFFQKVTGTPTYLITTNTVVNSLANVIQQDTILELVSDPTKKFIVIEVVPSTNRLLLTDFSNYRLVPGDVLKDTITDSNFTVASINNLPSINKFSGDLLYIDNRTSVSYSDQQLVTLKTFLKL